MATKTCDAHGGVKPYERGQKARYAMSKKRYLSIGIFFAAILVVGGLLYSTFGQPASAVADEPAAAVEEARLARIVLAGTEYPVNEYGLSYGDMMTVFASAQSIVEKDVNNELEFDDLLAQMPDLIEAKTNEGEDGYMLAEDYLRAAYFGIYTNKLLDEHGEATGDPELQVKIVSEASAANSVVTIYSADGTSVVGRNGYSKSDAEIGAVFAEDRWICLYRYPDGSVSLRERESMPDGAIELTRDDLESGDWVPLDIFDRYAKGEELF